ncbi:MAG: sigma-54 dependent transcriptional regulator, partial [Myxococcota bacterium]
MNTSVQHKFQEPHPIDAGRVLIVDDEVTIRTALKHTLSHQGYDVFEAEEGRSGLELLTAEGPFDAVLVDLRMPFMGGIEFLEEAHRLDPALSVLVITGQASVNTAVKSLKLGAFDYLTKPFDDIYAVGEEVVPRAIRASRQRRSVSELVARELDEGEGVFEGMIGHSASIKRVYELIAGVAPTDATVLIQGETGTGKELIARAIHNRSPRSKAPFVALNCAAVPTELLESELFGHERGSFTNAVAAKKGLFEEAHKGTLFLDEIAEMSPALQAKLLRVLQEGEIRRVGSSKTQRVDVRILAATHTDLREALKTGDFRDDL